MTALSLSGLNVYPIKSAAGVAVQTAKLTSRGLQHDRRWMIVDAQGKFITQRQFPRMALMSVALADTLQISAPEMPNLVVPPVSDRKKRVAVEVWGDACQAVLVGKECDAWLTQFLKTNCRLVYMPDDTKRPAEHGKLGPSTLVSFADAYPYLLISEASLSGLNQRLQEQGAEPVTMSRFRPNLIVSGAREPHAEDTWQQVKIGKATFDLPKPCARCSIPNVDTRTGLRGKEPTQTLSTYRFWNKGIWFGQNAVQAGDRLDEASILRVGDRIEVLSYQ